MESWQEKPHDEEAVEEEEQNFEINGLLVNPFTEKTYEQMLVLVQRFLEDTELDVIWR